MLIFTFNPKKHSEFPIYVEIKDNYDLLKYSEMAAIKINFFEWEITPFNKLRSFFIMHYYSWRGDWSISGK